MGTVSAIRPPACQHDRRVRITVITPGAADRQVIAADWPSAARWLTSGEFRLGSGNVAMVTMTRTSMVTDDDGDDDTG